MKKLVFLGSKPIGYWCLNYLLEKHVNTDIDIVGVHSNESHALTTERSIKSLCKEKKLRYLNDLDDILSIETDFILSVQYHKILKDKHIATARKLAVNLHMASLPEYRGCNQFSFAIFNEEKEFGTTFHVMEPGIDNGDILFQKRFPIPNGSGVKKLYDLTTEQTKVLFKESIQHIFQGNYKREKQSEHPNFFKSKIYYRKDIEKLKEIEISKNSQLKILATSMPGFQGPFTVINGKKFYFIEESD